MTWLADDILTLNLPTASVDVWHDRAVFHFLTQPAARAAYLAQVRRVLRPGGYAVIATFAEDGPLRCSGLEVARYSGNALHAVFGDGFVLEHSEREVHTEVDRLACPACHGAMRIVACITQPSVMDQTLSHLRACAATAAHGGARSPPSTRGPSGRRHATTRRGPPGPLRLTPTPRSRAGTFGVRVRPTGASDRSPQRPGAHGKRRPDGHRGAAAGGRQAAAHPAALAGSAIAPYGRRILDRPRLKFLSRHCSRWGSFESRGVEMPRGQ